MTAPRKTKENLIHAAIAVLKKQGSEGLTLRKVATEATVSLGNLQYHFRDRTALMAGMAEYYFRECELLLDDYQHTPEDGSKEEQLRGFILFMLDHVDHISDMCRMFREIWALSTRDEDIHRQMINYYEVTLRKLSELLVPLADSREAATAMACLLVPYIEGYSITFMALPQEKNETAQMLTKLCATIDR